MIVAKAIVVGWHEGGGAGLSPVRLYPVRHAPVSRSACEDRAARILMSCDKCHIEYVTNDILRIVVAMNTIMRIRGCTRDALAVLYQLNSHSKRDMGLIPL